MKRNVILAGLLGLLLLATWWFQEKGSERAQLKQQQQEQVFDTRHQGELKEISFDKVVLHQETDGFSVGEKHIPANPERIEEIFNALNGLSVVRVLNKEEAKALDPELSFRKDSGFSINFKTTKGNTKFVLGELLLTDSDKFYAKMNDKTLIVQDRRPLINAYKQEDEGTMKEDRLRNTFTLPPEFFYDARIFRTPFRIEFASFDNKLFKPYQANFKNMTTNPIPLGGLPYDASEFDAWRDTMQHLEAGTLHVAFNEKSLDDYRGQLKLRDENNKTVELSLFGKYGPLRGDFVISSLEPYYMYELTDNHAGIFFQSVQDFWQLVALPKEQVQEIALSEGQQRFQVVFEPGRVFNVKVRNQKIEPRRDRFAVFYNLLTGRAFYVSALDKSKTVDYKVRFVMQSGARTLSFAESAQEWLIIDSANALAYHYRKRDFSDLTGKLADYFGKP